MPADLPKARELFMHAVGKLPPEQWDAYIAEASGGNVELERQLRQMLQVHAEAGSFLERPAELPAATGDGETVSVDRCPENRASPGTVLGRYKLLEEIGEGGMGTVWMAEQTEPVKRKVAIKLIKPGMDSKQVLARFEAERQALALMDHPNIAKVHDAGVTSDGRPFFVMELVKGVPITEYCDDRHLTPRQRLGLFVPVCHAIQHAHQKGIIHRDIKPSNILVALYDDRPVPKVIDFGVAKATGQQLTEATLHTGFGAIVGTLEYMSPEQAEVNQLDIDTRSDIYSLGVLLYELLAGSTPFTKKDLEQAGMLEMLRVIREDEPSKPSTKLSSSDALPTLSANRGTEPAKLTKLVRGELDWIVMKALEKDRSRRYETANGFAMDVQRYLADEAVLACPPSAGYRLKKFVRRNKAPALAAAIVLLTLIGGIVGTTIGLVHAREARHAEAQRAEGERLAKEQAEANFVMANEAVEKYLGTVTNDRGLKRADFHRLRKKLLESAIPFFQKLTAQKSDDPEVEARRGRAYDRLGVVREAMGETEAALQDFEATRAIFSRLSADFPTVPEYRHDLAMSLRNIGVPLADLGKREKAEAAYHQAQEICEKLAADFPEEPKYRHSLAKNHNTLSILLADLGRHEEAERLWRQAVAIEEKLVADFPTSRAYRNALAESLSNLASSLTERGTSREAEAAYRRALDSQAKLAAEVPANPDYRESLAESQDHLGGLLAHRGKRKEAERLFRRAVADRDKLVKDFPTVPQYRHDLGQTLHNLASLVDDDRARLEEAEQLYRRAVANEEKLTADFPTVPAYRRTLAAHFNNLGLVLMKQGKRSESEAAYLRALDSLEKLAKDFPAVPRHSVDLGGGYCNFAVLVRGGGQPEAALGWFQKGITALEPVVAKEPRLVIARQFLCTAFRERAAVLDDLGRHDEATRDWERALELDDGDMKATYRLRIFRNKKDAAGCLAAAAESEARKPTDAGAMYDAACNRAVCAAVIREDPKTPGADAPRLAKEQADLAMAWLRKAVADGFTDAEHMKQDKDLDAPARERGLQEVVGRIANQKEMKVRPKCLASA